MVFFAQNQEKIILIIFLHLPLMNHTKSGATVE